MPRTASRPSRSSRSWRSGIARATGAAAGTGVVLSLPAIAAAHGLSPVYQSPLPLAVYLVGAAATVALSFVFVLARDVRATEAPEGRQRHVPAALRVVLRLIGVVAWAWIVAQLIAGGSSSAAVASLFLWVYGWVGVAMVSALLFPAWEWLDPITTFHDAGAWVLRRLGITGWEPSELPASARVWPAVLGLAFFVWLELVPVSSNATLSIVMVAYTLLSLALMAQFGRDEWRANGETFNVWFRTLNRIAPWGLVDGETVERRPFATGLLRGGWTNAHVVLISIGVASIIFDGFSQTVVFASWFGAPGLALKTLLLLGWLAIVGGAALLVARTVSTGAIAAGLLPIAVGYLVAHYLTYLLIDGQRIVIAISDPLQQGSDLLGTAFFEPSATWLPAGLVWTLQLAAVVGGHMLGAWAGHVTAQHDMEELANARPARDMRHRKLPASPAPSRNVRMREVPLAVVMVALTTITLWSLGQAIVVETAAEGAAPQLVATR